MWEYDNLATENGRSPAANILWQRCKAAKKTGHPSVRFDDRQSEASQLTINGYSG